MSEDMDERAARTPEEIAEGIQERANREKVKMWRARQRLVGSYVLGLFGFFKVLTAPALPESSEGVLGLGVSGAEVFWIGVMLLAFGLATFDQALKALGRGQ